MAIVFSLTWKLCGKTKIATKRTKNVVLKLSRTPNLKMSKPWSGKTTKDRTSLKGLMVLHSDSDRIACIPIYLTFFPTFILLFHFLVRTKTKSLKTICPWKYEEQSSNVAYSCIIEELQIGLRNSLLYLLCGENPNSFFAETNFLYLSSTTRQTGNVFLLTIPL